MKALDAFKREIEKYKAELISGSAREKEIEELKERLKRCSDTEEKSKVVAAKEAKIAEVIQRVEGIYESFQCNLTCLVCGEIAQKCALCIPCGHCFCGSCAKKQKICPNCSEKVNSEERGG